jgi:YidC/Oxa1 family membrane protein insertase
LPAGGGDTIVNGHLMAALADLLVFVGLAAVIVLALWMPARTRARHGSWLFGPPPAYAVALRHCARGEDEAAICALASVEEDAATRGTAWAAEAAYLRARIFRDRLRDDARAMQSYNTLATTYADVAFPHKEAARQERAALWAAPNIAGAGVPASRVLAFLVRLTGRHRWSCAFALLMLSTIVRLLLLPLTIRQHRESVAMQALQPEIDALRKKHADDPAQMQAALAALYRERSVNPAAGCLLNLIQAPIFWAVYSAVLAYKAGFKAGAFLWIGSGWAALHTPWLGRSLADPDLLLLAIYALSTVLQGKMMPAGDPAQAQMQKLTLWSMPLVMVVALWSQHVASAFVLYWLINNLFAIATQFVLQRRMPAA